MRESLLNIMVVGTADGIVMIESGAKEVKEETVVDAIEFAHTEIKKICAAINELRGKSRETEARSHSAGVRSSYYDDLKNRSRRPISPTASILRSIPRQKATPWSANSRKSCRRPSRRKTKPARRSSRPTYETLRERIFREQVINKSAVPTAAPSIRFATSGSKLECCRVLTGQPIFTRGETQALVTTTLGTSDDMQRLEVFEGEAKKRFMLHYNFPPFSVGEVAFLRGAGRREIGHGALAERVDFERSAG